MGGNPRFFSANHGQIRRWRCAILCRGRNQMSDCYLKCMELFLIILGGVLTTAIIGMMVDWARGRVLDDNVNPFDQTRQDDIDPPK